VAWWGILLYGCLGLAVGALLNQVIDRAPQRVPIWRPGPHCESCGTALGAKDLLPVVSYVVRRGRCSVCGAAIPPRVLWVEAGTGVLFALLAWYRGPSFELLADSVYTAFLVVIAVIDLEHHLILNRIIYPAIWTAVGLAIVRVALGQARELHYAFWAGTGRAAGATPAMAGFSSQIVGGLVGLSIFLVLYLISRGALGDGDVRLALLAGLMVGYPGVLLVVVAAVLLAGLVSAGLLVGRKASLKTWIPYGPFLVVAAWAVNLAGESWLAALL